MSLLRKRIWGYSIIFFSVKVLLLLCQWTLYSVPRVPWRGLSIIWRRTLHTFLNTKVSSDTERWRADGWVILYLELMPHIMLKQKLVQDMYHYSTKKFSLISWILNSTDELWNLANFFLYNFLHIKSLFYQLYFYHL